jgi:hypothetical protein
MTARTFAVVFGMIFLVVGILGFVPGLVGGPGAGAPPLGIRGGYGYLFGLFPINILHNLVHVVLGVWGLIAARALPPARTYARGLTWIYAILAVMGLMPGLSTLFGLVPLFGHDVWLHALTAIVAAWFGYRDRPVSGIEAPDEPVRERERSRW